MHPFSLRRFEVGDSLCYWGTFGPLSLRQLQSIRMECANGIWLTSSINAGVFTATRRISWVASLSIRERRQEQRTSERSKTRHSGSRTSPGCLRSKRAPRSSIKSEKFSLCEGWPP